MNLSAIPKKTSKFLVGDWLMKNTLERKIKILHSKKITKARVQSNTQESITKGPTQAKKMKGETFVPATCIQSASLNVLSTPIGAGNFPALTNWGKEKINT